MSFPGRMVLGALIAVVFTLFVLVWGSERSLRTSLEADMLAHLDSEAHLIADLLPEDQSAWQPLVDRMSRLLGHRIVIQGPDGASLATSDSIAGTRVARAEAPFTGGSVVLAASLDPVEATLARARRSMTGAALLALMLTLVLAIVAGRAIASPLLQFSAAARAVASGAPLRFPSSAIREVDALGHALRQMHGDLSRQFEQADRERAASAAILDAMTDGIVASDAAGRIAIANPAARRLLSYGPDAPLPTLQTLFRAKAAREAVSEILAGREVPDRVIERDGRILAIRTRNVDEAGVVVVLRDLTELRRLEAVRRDFVANVSHELKTPLTSISGYAETLVAGGVDEATTRKFLETIRSNASRMQALVDDLLDLSRIEAGRWEPNPEPLDLDAVVAEAWSLVAERAAAKQVHFTAKVDREAGSLRADEGAIRQILGNLLDNAIRHVESDGKIVVSASEERGGIALSVADNGAGISMEHLSRIFERFYRVDPSRSREEGGTGLGLSIVRHLVESHGGKVRAESTPRVGTTVTCWFPSA